MMNRFMFVITIHAIIVTLGITERLQEGDTHKCPATIVVSERHSPSDKVSVK